MPSPHDKVAALLAEMFATPATDKLLAAFHKPIHKPIHNPVKPYDFGLSNAELQARASALLAREHRELVDMEYAERDRERDDARANADFPEPENEEDGDDA